MDLWRLKRSIKRWTIRVSETGARPTDNLNVQVIRVFIFKIYQPMCQKYMESLRVIVGYCCQSDVDGEYSHYNRPKTPPFWKGWNKITNNYFIGYKFKELFSLNCVHTSNLKNTHERLKEFGFSLNFRIMMDNLKNQTI